MGTPKNPALFFGGIGIAIVAIALSVYYIIPGYSHLLVTHDSTSAHPTHAILFAAIALISILAAVINRPRNRNA